jgi:serine phosphatase RsbU (regulator of sigma subunit)
MHRFPFTLGRSADRDLQLANPHVSRVHAVIDRDVEGYVLRDLGSRHGTFVNGILITSTRLRSQDLIALGSPEQSFVFEEPEQESSSTRSILLQLAKAQSANQIVDRLTDSAEGSEASAFSSSSSIQSSAQADLSTLTLFLQAAQSLNQHGALKDVLRTMLEYTLRLTGAERGLVYLGDSIESFHLECAQTWDPGSQTGTDILDLPSHSGISAAIIRDAIGSQLDFFLSNVTGETAPSRNTLILNAIRSVAAIPLRGQLSGRLLGLLYLDSRRSSHDFTRTGKDILAVIAHQAATLLENLRMLEAEREAVLMRKELEIAASIQLQIIPQHLPEFPFARLSARTIPCTGVGGDFYDVIPVPNGFVAMVGDVCGKGVPAALLASMVQGMVHAQITTGNSLVDTIQSVNTFVCSRAPGEKYVTLAILRYTQPDGPGTVAQVELINGGHVAPVIVRVDGTDETVADGDMPVGLLGFAKFHSIPLRLAVGERVVLFSDGITEAEDPAGNQFGHPGLAAHLTQPDLIATLFPALDRFCQGAHALDDQTVLTIDRTA